MVPIVPDFSNLPPKGCLHVIADCAHRSNSLIEQLVEPLLSLIIVDRGDSIADFLSSCCKRRSLIASSGIDLILSFIDSSVHISVYCISNLGPAFIHFCYSCVEVGFLHRNGVIIIIELSIFKIGEQLDIRVFELCLMRHFGVLDSLVKGIETPVDRHAEFIVGRFICRFVRRKPIMLTVTNLGVRSIGMMVMV